MEKEAELEVLMARQEIVDTITRLFIGTDNKDWAAVKDVFADEVHFDMTSLAGGEPAVLTSRQIADAWEDGLKDVDRIHHQTGNYLVKVNGAQAEAFCYGIATHYRSQEEKKVTTFVGSYDLHLVREDGGWKINMFRFNSKYVE
jgi:hypothetical protein